MSKDTHFFKAGHKQYEVFVCPNDEHVEIYEKENPKEGLIFSTRKQLKSFVNSLTDVVEEIE